MVVLKTFSCISMEMKFRKSSNKCQGVLINKIPKLHKMFLYKCNANVG